MVNVRVHHIGGALYMLSVVIGSLWGLGYPPPTAPWTLNRAELKL